MPNYHRDFRRDSLRFCHSFGVTTCPASIVILR